jgi:DNA-binding ferritin-like protein
MSAQQIHFFFTLREQIKYYHWQTSSYARHKATDDLIKELDELIDQYVEIYMGKYGRPKITKGTSTVVLKNLTEKSAVRFVQEAVAYLQGPLTRALKGTDTDLANIRDEMIGHLNQILYLFTLK